MPLPFLILMTDTVRLPEPEAVIPRLPAGAAVILRHYDASDRAGLARRIARLCRRAGLRLLIGGDARLAVAAGADGLHLRESDLNRPGLRRCRPRWLVTAAAHSPAAIRRAARRGVDAVLVSPVFSTPSHPGAAPLGPLRFARLIRGSPLPVYALGGLTPETWRRLKGTGAVGVAGIGAILDPAYEGSSYPHSRMKGRRIGNTGEKAKA